MKAVRALLRECHPLNKAVTGLFTAKAASLSKAALAHHRLIEGPLLYNNLYSSILRAST